VISVGVVVTVELLSGTYEASDVEDRERPEWPPHPARLYCAMVAAARAESERSALLWLERQLPPLVCAAGRAQPQRRSGFVVTNEVTTKTGSQTHPARTNGLRVRSRAVPATPSVRLVWPGVEAPPGVVDALELRRLGDLPTAQTYAEESVRTASVTHLRGQVHRYAGLALILTAQGDIDRGVHVAGQMLDRAEGMESGRIHDRIDHVTRTLRRHAAEPIVAAFLERADEHLHLKGI
jgi:hypothetical protein